MLCSSKLRKVQTSYKQLIAPFTNLEIDEAVSSCASDKAPGPDGFNFRFIKSAWEFIKNDVYDIIHKLWDSSLLPHGRNVAFIALILKTDSSGSFKDFRPISMVGCLYKIITKLLTSRLQTVIGSVISPFQSSFVKGRQILDGALIASELIDSCKKETFLPQSSKSISTRLLIRCHGRSWFGPYLIWVSRANG